MGFAYMGTTFLPPLLGFIASHSNIIILPFFVITYIVVMLISSENIKTQTEE
jgi:fucose permease